MTTLTILLQAQGAEGGGAMSSILMIIAMIAIFYFFMIRPQSKRQKEIKKFRDSLKNGDKVVTAGGIYGKIKDIKPDNNVVVLEISDNVKIRIDKSSIYQTVQEVNEAQANSGNTPS